MSLPDVAENQELDDWVECPYCQYGRLINPPFPTCECDRCLGTTWIRLSELEADT